MHVPKTKNACSQKQGGVRKNISCDTVVNHCYLGLGCSSLVVCLACNREVNGLNPCPASVDKASGLYYKSFFFFFFFVRV